MSIAPGTRVGPYEVVSSIGSGGMGEVFKARDTRLQRDVALKVLPDAFARDADRQARFEREAQAIAALSHPNIVSVFDTGQHDGQLYVVMELLDGDSLRARLTDGALPTRKAIEIAVQVARGLAAAHDKGLVHRDLKPDNIFLLADGQVKILDFGLARPATGDTAATATALTNPGSVMGTVGYMAPEQVRGQAVDARTDLFAFGAVLYEMVSGQRAFQRDTSAETMTAILKEDPPELTGTRIDVSPALDRIIRHCLEKNAVERFQTARDVAFALGALSGSAAPATGATAAVPVAAPAKSTGRWRTAIAATLLVAVSAGAGALWQAARVAASGPSTFTRLTWDPYLFSNARFMPDGKTVVFSAMRSGSVPDLYVLRPDALAPQPLGLTATHLLSISSKGELAVLIHAVPDHHEMYRGTLARMTIDGTPRAWMDDVSEVDWAPNGTDLAVIRRVNNQDQLEYPAGTVKYTYPGYLSDPRVSPDGKSVAFMEHATRGDDRGFVKVVRPDGSIAPLSQEYWGIEGIAWEPDGRHLVFSASNAEFYRALRVATDGPSVPAPVDAAPGAFNVYIQDITADGRMLAWTGDESHNIVALLPGATKEREFAWLNFTIDGFLSNDHTLMSFTDLNATAGPNYAVAVRDMATDKVVRLGEGVAFGISPDSRWAGGHVLSTSELHLYPIGAGQPRTLPRGPLQRYFTSSVFTAQWMHQSNQIIVCGSDARPVARCYVQDIDTGAMTPATPEGIEFAWISPDDRHLIGQRAPGRFELIELGGATTTPAKGFTEDDLIIQWDDQGREVIVSGPSDAVAKISAVDPRTGSRRLLREIGPVERLGVAQTRVSQWLKDGYVYSKARALNTLAIIGPSSSR